jgi:hypothetical protein
MIFKCKKCGHIIPSKQITQFIRDRHARNVVNESIRKEKLQVWELKHKDKLWHYRSVATCAGLSKSEMKLLMPKLKSVSILGRKFIPESKIVKVVGPYLKKTRKNLGYLMSTAFGW